MPVRGPLSQIVVVDMTRVLAGPFCTMVLSDLGARVIKVEQPERGDDARQIGPFVGGKSAYFLSLNRGKESIALDLKDDADRQVFERLLARADVLVENYRPGTMEKLGYGWDELQARHPRLIYAAASGFGHTGPYAHRPAYDLVAQGMGGIMSLTGPPGGPPTRVGTSVGDITAGLFTAVGVNAALYEREGSGRGRKIDVAMLDCQVAVLENAIARYQATGEVPGPLGSRHPSITPFDSFATRDGSIIIAAGNDALFEALCEALGLPELARRPEFASNPRRTQNEALLRAELEATLAEDDSAEWLSRLEDADIPCGPINNVAQVLADPHVRARNMVVRIDDPSAGTLALAGNPIKLSGFPDPDTRAPAPDLDAQREALLAELENAPGEADDATRIFPPRLDALDLETLQTRLSEKWNRYARDVLPAWVAEMDFPLAEPIRLTLQRAVDHGDVGYPVAPKRSGLPEIFAERMQTLHGWSADPSRVEVITDVVQGIHVALEAFSRKGEGAVVQTPIYPPFLSAVAETERRLVENRLVQSDGGFEIDFDALRAALDRDTRLLMLCNPHNPSGRVFARRELEEIADIAARHRLIVVADEIHQDLLYDGRRHVPFASLCPEVALRTITLHSATKAFNIAGLRCAVAHFGSAELRERFNAAVPRHLRGGVGLLGIYATLAAWRHGEPWLDAVRRYLERNRDFVGRTLAERIPQLVFHAPEATYLAWLDCRALGLPTTPGAYFLRHARVALSDGHHFDPESRHCARLNFATSREILARILERLAAAVPDADREPRP